MRVKLNIFEISNIIRVTDYGASCPLEVSIKDNSKFILKLNIIVFAELEKAYLLNFFLIYICNK